MDDLQSNMYPVDVSHDHNGIKLLCWFFINDHGKEDHTMLSSPLQGVFNKLPPALLCLCGRVTFPPDDGYVLINRLQQLPNPLFGANDSSLKDGIATHAWVLSSGEADDLIHPLYSIHCSGTLAGWSMVFSSTRGKLQGQTAVATTSSVLMKHHITNIPVHMIGDNQGVQEKNSHYHTDRLKYHKYGNADL